MKNLNTFRYQFTILHPEQLIRTMIITVIMGDGYDGDLLLFQQRDDRCVKLPPEIRVLISSPFIYHEYRLFFQQSCNERQALALAGREIGG